MNRTYAESEQGIPVTLVEEQPITVYIQAAVLGFVTGVRSMTPLALLAWTSDKSKGSTTLLSTVAALGEAIADKLPIIPSRTSPGPFIGRLVIGGLGGFILCRRANTPPLIGIISGAAGAGIGSITSTNSRSWLSKVTKIPSPLWGGLEDILAFTLGLLVTKKKS